MKKNRALPLLTLHLWNSLNNSRIISLSHNQGYKLITCQISFDNVNFYDYLEGCKLFVTSMFHLQY